MRTLTIVMTLCFAVALSAVAEEKKLPTELSADFYSGWTLAGEERNSRLHKAKDPEQVKDLPPEQHKREMYDQAKEVRLLNDPDNPTVGIYLAYLPLEGGKKELLVMSYFVAQKDGRLKLKAFYYYDEKDSKWKLIPRSVFTSNWAVANYLLEKIGKFIIMV
jgi:hypothetical protein